MCYICFLITIIAIHFFGIFDFDHLYIYIQKLLFSYFFCFIIILIVFHHYFHFSLVFSYLLYVRYYHYLTIFAIFQDVYLV